MGELPRFFNRHFDQFRYLRFGILSVCSDGVTLVPEVLGNKGGKEVNIEMLQYLVILDLRVKACPSITGISISETTS